MEKLLKNNITHDFVTAKSIWKNIITVVLLFSLLGSTILLSQQGYIASNSSGNSTLIDEDMWYSVRNENAGAIAANASNCLLIFDKCDPDSIELRDNLEYTLNSINVNVNSLEVTIQDIDEKCEETEDLAIGQISVNAGEKYNINIDYSKYDDIIFCTASISDIGLSANDILEWCKNGGHVIFADGFDENVNFEEWNELLGVDLSEEYGIVFADSLQFNTSILFGVEGKEFSDDVIASEVYDFELKESCTVHISTSDENDIPLLWENTVNDGKVIACNADLMNSKNDRGIIAAVYCQLYPAYVYPVINSCVYCIDDCPSPSPAGYDKNIVSQYGYTVKDFYSNVWMPAMQKIAEKYNIRYSTFSIQTYENNVTGPFDNTENKKSAAYYASLVLNMGGEIGIHGYNHQPLVLDGYEFDEENSGYTPWPSVSSMIKSLKSAVSYTEGLVDDLYIQSYVAPSNVLSNEALQEMLSQMEDIRVYAGVYMGTKDQFVQEYEVTENGCVFCPRLTADMQMEDSEWWTQINELNFHYIESNFIHPDDILDEERSDGGDFNQMLSGYSEMIEWNQKQGLRTCTISECGGAVQRFCNLNYSQQLNGNILSIHVEGLIDTAYLMLRTNGKKPVSVEGGTITEMNDSAYILEINSENVKIKLVDTK